jgi:hypothetical protein
MAHNKYVSGLCVLKLTWPKSDGDADLHSCSIISGVCVSRSRDIGVMERPTFATLYVGVNTYDEIPAKLFISLYELKDKIDVKPGDTTRLVISNLDQLRDSLVAGYVKDGVVEPFERIISFMSELYKIDKQMPFRKLRKTSDTKYYYSGWIPRVPIVRLFCSKHYLRVCSLLLYHHRCRLPEMLSLPPPN